GGGVKQVITPHYVVEHAERSLGRRLTVDRRILEFCGSIGSGALSSRLRLNPSFIETGMLPELTGDLDWIDASLLPPGVFVAGAMRGAVMRAAQRDGKFIAGFAAERARLHKSDVMRVRGFAAAQQARLLHHKAKVVPIAIAAGRRHREHALIDADLISATCIDLANLVTTSVRALRRSDFRDLGAF